MKKIPKETGKILISVNESTKTDGSIELIEPSDITLFSGKTKYTYKNKPFICDYSITTNENY